MTEILFISQSQVMCTFATLKNNIVWIGTLEKKRNLLPMIRVHSETINSFDSINDNKSFFLEHNISFNSYRQT